MIKRGYMYTGMYEITFHSKGEGWKYIITDVLQKMTKKGGLGI